MQPRELDAIVLSHKHLDHSGDVNVLIEAMICRRFRPRGTVFAPADAFDASRSSCRTRNGSRSGSNVSNKARPVPHGDVELRMSIAHVHASQTRPAFRARRLRVASSVRAFFEGDRRLPAINRTFSHQRCAIGMR